MILAIDTATRWTSLALHDGQAVLAEYGWMAFKTQTIELAPRIQTLLEANHLTTGDLGGLAVAIGPGSYTGLRIGLGLAKGIALVHRVPLFGVPTLDITAAGVPIARGESLIVTIEAGRQRIIAGRYEAVDGRWQSRGRPEILSWEELAGSIGSTPTIIAGEISGAARSRLEAGQTPCQLLPPAAAVRRAGWLAELGWQRLRAGKIDDPQTLTPDYLRRPEGS